MSLLRARRRWIALGVLVVVALATLRLLYQPVALESYRMSDPKTILVTGYGAPSAWTHLSDVSESGSAVTVRVDAFTFEPLPHTDAGARLDVTVRLGAPLGDRSVIDASTGQEIPAAPAP